MQMNERLSVCVCVCVYVCLLVCYSNKWKKFVSHRQWIFIFRFQNAILMYKMFCFVEGHNGTLEISMIELKQRHGFKNTFKVILLMRLSLSE